MKIISDIKNAKSKAKYKANIESVLSTKTSQIP